MYLAVTVKNWACTLELTKLVGRDFYLCSEKHRLLFSATSLQRFSYKIKAADYGYEYLSANCNANIKKNSCPLLNLNVKVMERHAPLTTTNDNGCVNDAMLRTNYRSKFTTIYTFGSKRVLQYYGWITK